RSITWASLGTEVGATSTMRSPSISSSAGSTSSPPTTSTYRALRSRTGGFGGRVRAAAIARRRGGVRPGAPGLRTSSAPRRSGSPSRQTARGRRTRTAGWRACRAPRSGRDRRLGRLLLVLVHVRAGRVVELAQQHLLVTERERLHRRARLEHRLGRLEGVAVL